MDAIGPGGTTYQQMINTDFAWMINLAAGGGWPIDPQLGTPSMPANLLIDYVRFYEHRDGPALPTLTVADAAASEAAGSLTFTVTLSAASTLPVTVQYATAPGSAQAGTDYTPVGDSLTFAPGQTTQRVVVPVSNDATVEANENFVFSLTAPTGATLADANATGTIFNDDTSPLRTITGTNADETLIGTTDGDMIFGLAGRDSIYGRAGPDVIVGGPGIDTLRGESGNDTFVFQTVSDSPRGSPDNIRDWSAGDRIDLSAIDAIIGTQANDAFTFIGNNAFTRAGEVRVSSVAYNGVTYTLVEANVDAVLTADLTISLTDPQVLASADLIL
jgi:Calx-beta domain/Peptidase M10 serralysin C terminal